ncbi:3-isopropylmalate dehydratase large subunit [Helicobacter sp. MIT 03-1614]|jgi:3-isopropylmalate/(R)-2-methylmalate dehydratase large subunit|uniref:3-isopropylmalate dehydratase large subunit n=1 Tax=Helicobacter hepaticus (strain ATCC 51449 / 3B1) TaxID=235279 RepID=LEUC_HELHP|nr:MULTISPECIES: 3-isopropylmalate dehydratase large subunit [Helicobacter]Q7VH31.1 RecName: Full=3-isopropylmalate dehydratase large subunit; AltName: Full=Alpha-IPM isomerase; Short=IPMI; AltName: Full=Isopropylmalate isomerase [Helicobacter hepaticus ATCC 51449]AAP77733.1 3-isopropylmalate dehydratase [Helicobacter hepaticus ATCC 51449]TLD90936.1 3-isopropylmalate dehydratase large subunit [Helicobacter sp. MIT 03-1614]
MGMTMSQKILADRAGLESVRPNDLIMAKLDMVLGNDITTPVAINAFKEAKFQKVFDKDKISLVMDHFAPNKDIKAATQSAQCRCFAKDFDISHYYDVGNMGVEHALLPEQGIVTIGDLIIGADSHTCTYGALGAFSTGVGSTDMAVGMATGQAWFKVPYAIKFNLKGKLRPYVSGKDVILHIIGKIGVDGALYKSMEFGGEGLKNLTIDDRLCIANMAIEAGAKNGIFEVDDITISYAKGRTKRDFRIYKADVDAEYEQVFDIDLDSINHTVAFPHLPENTKEKDDWGEIKIDQVVIGSCTNGRLSDMAVAAEILKDKTIAKNTRCIIIPATQNIYLECINRGYLETFIKAGAVVSTPTCGPCLGGHMGILAANEKCVSTTNRNFVGRMGHITSEVYLSSPEVAAASAVRGILSAPQDIA